MNKKDTLNVCGESYGYWPEITIKSDLNLYGQYQCLHLDRILNYPSPEFEEWRSYIPCEILAAVLRFPEARGELLLMAQVWPQAFLDIFERAPAWLLVAANFWIFEGRRFRRPSDADRLKFFSWFFLMPKSKTLARLGFETRSKVRVLARLELDACLIPHIFRLAELLDEPKSAPLLRYLPSINSATLSLVCNAYHLRDFHLLALAARQPLNNGERIEVVLRQIEDWLWRGHRGENWPYEGRIQSWLTLRRVRTRLQIQAGNEDPFCRTRPEAQFRDSPFDLVEAKERFGLEVVALNSRELLQEETELMSNCTVTYSEVLPVMHELFIYRIIDPYRATLLICEDGKRWIVSQLYGPANAEVEPEERELIERWLDWENGKSGD